MSLQGVTWKRVWGLWLLYVSGEVQTPPLCDQRRVIEMWWSGGDSLRIKNNETSNINNKLWLLLVSQYRLSGHSTSNCEVFPDVYKSQVLHFKSEWLPVDNASQGRNLQCKPEAGPGVHQPAPSVLWALTRGWTLHRTKWHTRCPADTADEHSSLHTTTRAQPSSGGSSTPPETRPSALAGSVSQPSSDKLYQRSSSLFLFSTF